VFLEATTLPPANGQPAKAGIVLLHGWGANAADLAPLVKFWELPGVEFYLPNAPWPHPQGAGGRMWYDLFQDQQGLPESREALISWLKNLASSSGLGLERMVLAGFSQGGAMALDVGLSLPLAGVISWSGYLHAPPVIAQSPAPPVLLIHGCQDMVVPVQLAQAAQASLRAAGVSVQYHELEMGHEITPEALNRSFQFLTGVLGKLNQETRPN
jgi:phospholipase/carboxylesterase